MARAWCIVLWREADGTRGHAILRVRWDGTNDVVGQVIREERVEWRYLPRYVPVDVTWCTAVWYDQMQRRLREYRAE